jgi:tyrosine-protein phosphatase YwqE
MLFLFKSSHYLKDLLPENYVDIHNHLLPGIDDGAKSVQETDLLIAGMKQLNIHSAIATPHSFSGLWDNTTAAIKNAFATAIDQNSNSHFLKGYASEYMLDTSLMARLKNEPLLCIHENYILLEFNLFTKPINLYDMLFEIKVSGYKIIIAHPERYLYFHDNIKKYEKLKEYGVYFQLNLLTLVGHYGKDIKKIAEQLLEKELYDFTGTDIHNEGHIQKLLTKPIRLSKKNKMTDLLQKNNLFILDKVPE